MNPIPVFVQPTQAEVEYALRLWQNHAVQAMDAGYPGRAYGAEDSWKEDHADYMIGLILPVIRPPYDLWQVTAEAYLCRGFEGWSDGSTLVPDSKRYGHIKDWQGVMHDYLFYLHHMRRRDAYGREWGYFESNAAYGRAWAADGQWGLGQFRRAALNIGSWPVWCGWL